MIPAISIQNLTKHYKKFKALDSISFQVQEGEFFGFLGPNGAGKTTTISAITGLAHYNSGEIRVFGQDVKKDYQKTRAMIGLVPQEFNFDPFLSAHQILTYEGGYFGLQQHEARRRAQELLETFGLMSKSKEGYKKLSGGMKRRLLLARALMHRPKILILDEPTAGVDLELRYQLWDFLRRINKQGTTILLTTHYIEEAEKLCNHIGVIHEGRIVAMDPTENLIRKISGDQVELYLAQPLAKTLPELEALSVRLIENGSRLQFEETGDMASRVLKAVHACHLEIQKIDVRKPRLEDAFLKLVTQGNKSLSEYTR